jgi:putative DNA primase/helicase
MKELARFSEGIPVQSKDLDSNPWMLNCLNGTIDLKVGKCRPHRREDLITKLVPVEYDECAECPTWEKALQEILNEDEDLIRFFHKAIGYSLTGDVSEQCLFMMYGTGANGKSTLLVPVREILSDYHCKTGTDTLLEKEPGGPTNDIARLRGARFVTAIEVKLNGKLAEALVKELTGGDTVTARFLHKEFFEYVPQFKLWVACNHLPYVDGQDYGIWRRMRLIPFKVQFKDADDPEGPYKDTMLLDKLRLEYQGILTWMVKGCLLWQAEGLGEPIAVKEATEKYRCDMDVLADFFDECCLIGMNYRVKLSALHLRYMEWSKARGERYSIPKRAFSQRLEERGIFQKYKSGGTSWWRGIGVKDSCDLTDSSKADDVPENEQDYEDF